MYSRDHQIDKNQANWDIMYQDAILLKTCWNGNQKVKDQKKKRMERRRRTGSTSAENR